MTLKRAAPALAAVGLVGAVWWLTRPRGSVTFGPLSQPISGAGDGLTVAAPTFPVLHGPGGLEPAMIAKQRPENLSGQGLSNAEVDRILDAYHAELRANGVSYFY